MTIKKDVLKRWIQKVKNDAENTPEDMENLQVLEQMLDNSDQSMVYPVDLFSYDSYTLWSKEDVEQRLGILEKFGGENPDSLKNIPEEGTSEYQRLVDDIHKSIFWDDFDQFGIPEGNDAIDAAIRDYLSKNGKI